MKNSVKEKLTKSSLITSFGAIAKFKLLCLIAALATIVYLGFLQSDRYASVAMLVINQNSSVDSNRIAADNFFNWKPCKNKRSTY